MERAIGETNRRRRVQIAYNKAHDIPPAGIVKDVRDLTDRVRTEARRETGYFFGEKLSKAEAARLIKDLEREMRAAARELEFEKAAMLRDQIFELRRNLPEEERVPEWERYRQTI